jgi:hypothetical protein
VPADRLRATLGITEVEVVKHTHHLAIVDSSLA